MIGMIELINVAFVTIPSSLESWWIRFKALILIANLSFLSSTSAFISVNLTEDMMKLTSSLIAISHLIISRIRAVFVDHDSQDWLITQQKVAFQEAFVSFTQEQRIHITIIIIVVVVVCLC